MLRESPDQRQGVEAQAQEQLPVHHPHHVGRRLAAQEAEQAAELPVEGVAREGLQGQIAHVENRVVESLQEPRQQQ